VVVVFLYATKKTKKPMAMALDFAVCGFESSCNEIKNMMMMNSTLVHGLGVCNLGEKNHYHDKLSSSFSWLGEHT
jgi:hypothetical protein